MTDNLNYYKDHTKDELIKLLNEKDEELQLTKVFTNTLPEENLDSTLQWRGRQRFLVEKISPVKLKPIIEKSYHPEYGDNLIIDGDNLSVMYSLLKDYRGNVDIIYMDPPYNTGEDVFPYNDNFMMSKQEVKEKRREAGRSAELISLDDPNRHTKWINHIAPRLWAAKKLMKQSGVIIISIDEHELPRLWLLMEEIFGENNRVATLIWERSRKNDATYISEGHEYMLVWARNKVALDSFVSTNGKWRIRKPGLETHIEKFKELRNLYGDNYQMISDELKKSVKGIKKDNPLWTVRQYVGIDNKCDSFGPYKEDDPSWPGPGGPTYDVLHPDTKQPVKVPTNGWRYTNETIWNELIKDDRVVWKMEDKGIPKIKKYLLDGRENEVFTSVIQKESRGSVLLSKAIFGKDNAYKNPKDHVILHKLFNLVTWSNPNAIILDPYAGSGTTANAVISMNSEDNGNRRFILIEGGYINKKSRIKQDEYTDTITAERVRRILSGKWADNKKHPSYNSGFTFFKADKAITKESLIESDRENLSDIILQVADEESNRIDCRINGYRYLIGHTRSGSGIALVWEPGKNGRTLTLDVLKEIVNEVDKQDCQKPIHIYAASNEGPVADNIYRFHQIPEAILIKLGISSLDITQEEDTL